MLRTNVFPFIFATFLLIVMIGCDKKSGDAVVLAKEHIDAALPKAETPEPSVSPNDQKETARAASTQKESESTPDVQIHEMANDEIDVDGIVMKAEVRGTGHDPRAMQDERWLVKVRILDIGRTINVETDQARWQKLRENDRVKIKYRVGKYTGSVWYGEIE